MSGEQSHASTCPGSQQSKMTEEHQDEKRNANDAECQKDKPGDEEQVDEDQSGLEVETGF